MVNRDEDGAIDKGVLFVTIAVSEGKVEANGERSATDGRRVRVRSRYVRLGNTRGTGEATVLRGLERRERRVRQGREVRKEKSVILWKALELRVKVFSPGVESGVVMVLMLFDEAERDVRDGKKLVNFTI